MNALINSFGSESAIGALPSTVGDYLFQVGKRPNTEIQTLPSCIANYCDEIRHRSFWWHEPLPQQLKDFWKEAEEITITLNENSPGLCYPAETKFRAKRLPMPDNGHVEPGLYGLMVNDSLTVTKIKDGSLPVANENIQMIWQCLWIVNMPTV